MASVSQIVQQIIESLGESISRLMMMVIVFQEKNAEPPPQLPGGVQVVTKSSFTLHQVANSLASTEYAEYPDIKREIEEASEIVRVSTEDLTQSLSNLMNNSDRAAGWDGLVNSCKEISSKTIKLLQIVYGAERERVFRAAQNALDALNALDGSNVVEDPQDWANRIQNAIKKGKELAAYVKGKADDCEDPQKKKELYDLVNMLNEDCDTLFRDGTALLKDRGNEQKQMIVTKDINQLKQHINDAISCVENMDRDFDDSLNQFEDKSKELSDSLKELENSGKKDLAEDILYTAKKELQELNNMQDDIENGDKNDAINSLNNAQLYNSQLVKLAQMQAENCKLDNPELQQALLDAGEELDNYFPSFKEISNFAINNPDNDEARDNLDDAHDFLEDMINKLCNLVSTVDAEIGASSRKELEDLEDLKEAAKNGDGYLVSRFAKAVVTENNNLTENAKIVADNREDPIHREMILNNIEELQRLLPHEILAAKEALENPDDVNLDKLDNKTDLMKIQVAALRDIAREYPEITLLDLCAKERRFLDEIYDNSMNNRNPDAINELANAFVDNSYLLTDVAKEIATKKPKATQALILQATSRLEKLIDPVLQSSTDVANGNDNSAAVLNRDINEMRKCIDEILGLTDAEFFAQCLKQKNDLANLRNAANDNDLAGLQGTAKQIAKRQASIIPLAKSSAKLTEDPLRRKQLLNDVNELNQLLPNTINSVSKVIDDPDDQLNKQKLENEIDLMDNILNGLIDPNQYDPNRASKVNAGLVGNNNFSSNNFNDDQDGDIRDLADLMPDFLLAAERAAKNPHDKVAQKELQDILEQLPLHLLETDEERLAHLMHDQNDLLTKLAENAEAGNHQNVDKIGKMLQANNENLIKQAEKMAQSIDDPVRQQNILNSISELERLTPVVIANAKEVANDPTNEQNKKTMYKNIEELRKNMDNIHNNAVGTVDQNLVNLSKEQKDALEELRENVNAGNPPGTKQSLEKVKGLHKQLVAEGRTAAGSIRDPKTNKRILDTLNELESLMPILEVDCNNSANQPNNQNANKKANDDIDRYANLIDSLLSDTRSDPIALAQKEMNVLDNLERNVNNNDPANAATNVKDLIDTHKLLCASALNEAKKLPPARANNINNAINELNQLMNPHVQHAKNALMNPDNEKYKEDLSNSTNKMKAPLAEIIASIRPTKENIAEATKQREKALLAQLRDAAGRGDTNEVERLLNDINTVNNRLVQQAKQFANNCSDPETKKKVLQHAANLQQLNQQLPAIARNAANNPNNQNAQDKLFNHTSLMENEIDSIVNNMSNPGLSDQEKARRLVNAMLRQSRSGRIDSGKFLNAAQTLAGFINGMVVDDDEDDDEEEEQDLDFQLSQLDSKSLQSNKESVNSNVDDLVKNVAENSKPKTFDQQIQQVANNINRAANQYNKSQQGGSGFKNNLIWDGVDDIFSFHTKNVADELSEMANAAKMGQRTDMIEAGRNASKHINNLCLELGPLAKDCKDPRVKGDILRAMQAMKNYSVQLKILASVRAGAGEGDCDTEDQLVSIAKSLGGCLQDSLNNVSTVKNAKLVKRFPTRSVVYGDSPLADIKQEYEEKRKSRLSKNLSNNNNNNNVIRGRGGPRRGNRGSRGVGRGGRGSRGVGRGGRGSRGVGRGGRGQY